MYSVVSGWAAEGSPRGPLQEEQPVLQGAGGKQRRSTVSVHPFLPVTTWPEAKTGACPKATDAKEKKDPGVPGFHLVNIALPRDITSPRHEKSES